MTQQYKKYPLLIGKVSAESVCTRLDQNTAFTKLQT